MTPPAPSPPEPSPEARRLRQFILFDIPASLGGLIFLLVVYLLFPFPWIWLIIGAVFLNTLLLFVALWFVWRNEVEKAITVICVSIWFIVLASVYLVPQIFPGVLVLIIWPVSIAVPYLSRRNLKRLMIISSGVAVIVAFLSLRPDAFDIAANFPPLLIPGANVVLASVFTALTLFQLWHYSGRLNDTLDQMRARGQALQESERSLERKVAERTQALEERNDALAQTLQQLRATQNQLILQEKLASLGALTAGIAHEIKNPLNFVNNLAQLVVEMTQELGEELEPHKERLDLETAAEIETLLADLTQTATKIHHHGQRADTIVQGMLQHSRQDSGQKELTDLNQLLAEYVNLAYHGLRAKDPEFHITIEQDYDPAVGRVMVAPQDMGRVFLNLINNACYAAHQKQKAAADTFSPTLWVGTRDRPQAVEIYIRDNGPGIPAEVRDQIFHPFFTTKPSGQGTGLGLSISYEIVTQGHQGHISFETAEGHFTHFVILLPKAG